MTTQSRKPYQKPSVAQVALVPAEAVLDLCKNMSGGPEASNCLGIGPNVVQCFQDAS